MAGVLLCWEGTWTWWSALASTFPAIAKDSRAFLSSFHLQGLGFPCFRTRVHIRMAGVSRCWQGTWTWWSAPAIITLHLCCSFRALAVVRLVLPELSSGSTAAASCQEFGVPIFQYVPFPSTDTVSSHPLVSWTNRPHGRPGSRVYVP